MILFVVVFFFVFFCLFGFFFWFFLGGGLRACTIDNSLLKKQLIPGFFNMSISK